MIPRIEYEARTIDTFGDAVDIWHFASNAEAVMVAERLMARAGVEYVAVAVERHDWRKHEAGKVCESYTTVATFGDPAAIALWEGVTL